MGLEMNEPAKPLSDIQAGQQVRLAGISAGCDLGHRLRAMGLSVPVTITVVSNNGSGPLIIGARGGKLMIGRGMARQIMVVSTAANPE